MKWLKDLLSVDEARLSTLIVCLLITLAFSLLMYWSRGDINDSLVNILMALIGSVAGTNILATAINYYQNQRKNNKE
ncbi:hypothetical protein D3C87_971910 [compost metagenome]